MFCPKCGTANEDTAAFCGKCGHNISAPVAAQPQPPVATPPRSSAPSPFPSIMDTSLSLWHHAPIPCPRKS
ncbi:MAG: zinc ribbon domain-containing protein [Chloroflexi bacterium]|nr:zinc ribbon domain-containing protein [Chloroflexota bacterium]